ncbi:MAG TPA: SDR family oxidoreductase [Gemmatimonadaceae bacterium]|jgi:NAD(P)-dependent dehydrogenase (short-subunit alcohol dehydrogenase family)
MPDLVRAAFSGSTVLLTGIGADGQVGQAVARAFAEQGASLVLVDRTTDHVDARVNELTRDGLLAAGYPCDLTDGAAVKSLVGRIREKHGDAIHAFVHMAGGFAMSGPVAESTDDVWNRQIAINLTTAFTTARAVLPMVRAGRGAIVFFASEAVLPGSTGARASAYAVAKSGVVALMRAIAAEERPNGVRANAVAPSSIRTATNVRDMGDKARYVEREQVADVVLFLCSGRASAISGLVVPIA